MASRRDFLSQAAPENYVAGLGRGATGFTTRSDLGPAREGPSTEQIQEALAKRAQQLGAAPPTAYGATDKKKPEEDDRPEEDDERFQDPENETGLFAYGQYDRDDDEADRIYQDVDERMERRRKLRRLVRPCLPLPSPFGETYGLSSVLHNVQIADMNPTTSREAREKEEREDYERNNPKIAQQFADLKRSLATVSDEDWANIPEVGDLTGKNRRTKQNLRQRFYAVPDSVLAGARDSTQFETSVQEDGAPQANGSSRDNADGTMTNFADIGAARDRVLQVRLDQAAQADAGTGTATSIDPKGYLTSLSQTESLGGMGSNVGDYNRVRVLLESVIKTNPKHAPGWIAIARLEEVAGKSVQARKLIAQGCEQCPKSEDAWMENIRLNDKHNAKIIAANAIKNNERSTRLWVEAMNLETDPRAKKRVVRQAIDHIPQSVAIWKEAVNLEEDPNDAKLLLAKATEIIPLSVELWLALARLEAPETAQQVLNKARKAVPTSYEIWIAAARLQEQMGTADKVNVMNRAVKSLARENAMLKREEWTTEAEKCEEEGAVLTCGAIIRETLGWSLDEDDDRKEIWMDDAKVSIGRGRYETARAIYAYALRVFPTKKSIWEAAADLERNHGSPEALSQLLEKAVEACPQSETMWMQLARLKWQAAPPEADDTEKEQARDAARQVLARAFVQNEGNENIWLAAVKLEADARQTEKVRELLTQAREEAGTDRVWIKSVAYERQFGNTAQALDLANLGLQRYPKAAKLWMMKGQIYDGQNQVPQARVAYSSGTQECPKSVPLWLLASRLEEKAGLVVKARSVLDRARLKVPKNDELWTESVRVERRVGNIAQAKVLMAKALQECPNSGLLWSENIWNLEPRTQRKPRSLEAMRKVENDPILVTTVARIFWGERRLDKAISWFEKALLLDSDLGDTWGWYYKFLQQHGTDEKIGDVIAKCMVCEPKHGEYWQSVAKEPGNAYLGVEEVLKLVAGKLS